MPEPNRLLRARRENTPSRTAPGQGMSRQELVKAIVMWLWDTTQTRYDLDPRLLAKWESGAVKWPASHYRSALRAVLGASSDAELGLSPTGQSLLAASTVPGTNLATATEPWRLTDVLTRSAISGAALEQMERTVLGYAACYPTTPPDDLLPLVAGQLQRLHAALDQPQRLRERRRAVVLLGVLSGLSGNLWLDLGRADVSAGYFDVGELAAQEANDPDLAAWVLATRSVGPFHGGQHQQAAELLTRAEQLAAYRSSYRRQAWIAALHARADAAAGDREGSLRALDRARSALDCDLDPVSGTDFFDGPRLDGIAGTTYLAMGDTANAVPLLGAALDRRAVTDAKGRALITLDLAECRVIENEPGEAARLAMSALRAASGSLVGPILDRARALQTRLAPWRAVGEVRNLEVHVKELARG
jgi:tetratricopeptide (TPR) repeat protein